jgi:hypothetical protein
MTRGSFRVSVLTAIALVAICESVLVAQRPGRLRVRITQLVFAFSRLRGCATSAGSLLAAWTIVSALSIA